MKLHDVTPIFASRPTAARLCDMASAEFTRLVDAGHLPGPRLIGGVERWDVEELRRIVTGEAVEGLGNVSW
jgi:hypothetical protein